MYIGKVMTPKWQWLYYPWFQPRNQGKYSHCHFGGITLPMFIQFYKLLSSNSNTLKSVHYCCSYTNKAVFKLANFWQQ
jgi:hypothetical protein